MKKMWGVKKVFSFMFLALTISVLLTACGGGGGGSDGGGGNGGGDGGGGSAPSAPTGVTATAGGSQVTISWNAVSGATSYNTYWSTTSGVTKTIGTKITGATSPYTHTGLTNGTTYYYVVTAENSYGESGESSESSATPLNLPSDADLISYWSFDSCSVVDETGNGYDGTTYGSPECVDGVFGKAYDMGYGDYVRLNKTLDPNDMDSISFWIYNRGPEGWDERGIILAKYSWYGYRSFLIGAFNNGTCCGNIWADSFETIYFAGNNYDGDYIYSHYTDPDALDERYTIVNNQGLPLDQWTHVVINRTPTEVEIWFDAQLVSKVKRDYVTYYNSSEPTYIGNAFYIGGDFTYHNYLNGTLDQFRIYGRHLTESEIKALFLEGSGSGGK